MLLILIVHCYCNTRFCGYCSRHAIAVTAIIPQSVLYIRVPAYVVLSPEDGVRRRGGGGVVAGAGREVEGLPEEEGVRLDREYKKSTVTP